MRAAKPNMSVLQTRCLVAMITGGQTDAAGIILFLAAWQSQQSDGDVEIVDPSRICDKCLIYFKCLIYVISICVVIVDLASYVLFFTSNVTGYHRGPKRKRTFVADTWRLLWVLLQITTLYYALYYTQHCTLRILCFIAECGIACRMRVIDVRVSSSSPRLPSAKFRSCRGLRCWTSPWRKLAYSSSHSLNHSPSLFDAPGTEACTFRDF